MFAVSTHSGIPLLTLLTSYFRRITKACSPPLPALRSSVPSLPPSLNRKVMRLYDKSVIYWRSAPGSDLPSSVPWHMIPVRPRYQAQPQPGDAAPTYTGGGGRKRVDHEVRSSLRRRARSEIEGDDGDEDEEEVGGRAELTLQAGGLAGAGSGSGWGTEPVPRGWEARASCGGRGIDCVVVRGKISSTASQRRRCGKPSRKTLSQLLAHNCPVTPLINFFPPFLPSFLPVTSPPTKLNLCNSFSTGGVKNTHNTHT